MTNAITDNSISTQNVVLWQYDKAVNFCALVAMIEQMGKMSTEQFWNYFAESVHGLFAATSADDFGLAVWGILVGMKRPSYSTGTLSAALYRKVLGARIRLLMSGGALPDIAEYVTDIFGKNKVDVIDSGNMAITYTEHEGGSLGEEQAELYHDGDYWKFYPAGVRDNEDADAGFLCFRGQYQAVGADKSMLSPNFYYGEVGGSERYWIKEGEREVARHYHDSTDGLYHPGGKTYEDIMEPYWRHAADARGEVTAFVIKTEANSLTFKFEIMPMTGSTAVVDWGDGTTTSVSSDSTISHVYANASYFVISATNVAEFACGDSLVGVDLDMPRRVLRFSNGLTSLNNSFVRCSKLGGEIPDFPSTMVDIANAFTATEVVGPMPTMEMIERNGNGKIDGAYNYCSNLTGVMQRMPNNIQNGNYGLFVAGCGSLEGVFDGATADTLMPVAINSSSAWYREICDTGTAMSVRKRFFSAYGGTNGWTGGVYTAENAPVPDLVGQRIYEPIGNVTSFEIQIKQSDFTDSQFVFEMTVKSFNNKAIRIDWGDGSLTTCAASDYSSSMRTVSHTYTKKGTETNVYAVCLDGGAKQMRVGRTDDASPITNSMNVVSRALSWSDSIESTSCAYYACENAFGTIPPWGASITDAGNTYRKASTGHSSFSGPVPAWPNSVSTCVWCYSNNVRLTGRVPEWPTGISRYDGVFSNCNMTGTIPRWNGSAGIRYNSCYYRNSGLTGFFEGATLSDTCPTTGGGSANYYNCYAGCSDAVRNLAYVSWGGLVADPT